jgi:FtsH-binding integral membrane protein
MRLFHHPIMGAGSGPWEPAIDDGFAEYLYAIYRYMTGGLLVSGAVAYLCATSPLYRLLATEPLIALSLLLVPLGYVVMVSRHIERISPTHAARYFWLFAILIGFSFGGISQLYWGDGIAHAFFETAAAFLVVSLIGFFSKRALTAMGTFIMLTLVGIGLALMVDHRQPAPELQLLTTIAGILIFAALTACNSTTLKHRFYMIRVDDDIRNPKPSIGALSLYLDFINRFLSLLRIKPRHPPREG